jgi:CRP-like cAMP-binding protein
MNLTETELRFYGLLRYLIQLSELGQIRITHATLAAMVGCTAITSYRNIRRLREKGLVIVCRTGRENIYRLAI